MSRVFIYLGILLILILTSINIHVFLGETKVLGVQDKIQEEEVKFWEKFLNDNPDYIPGWIEIGDLEKVKQIDPNYFLQP